MVGLAAHTRNSIGKLIPEESRTKYGVFFSTQLSYEPNI